jgi:hypothetical protein
MTFLASIAFTNPLLLLGLAGASLPVLAHLLNRRTRRTIVFPTIRLLRESRASQSRLYRLRRYILMALRCLAVAAIALAFARPLWLERGTPAVAPGKGAALVLILDNSVSSAQQVGGMRLIDSMRAVAGRILGALEQGTDLAGVIYASAQPRSVLPQLSTNVPALRADLDHLSPSQERADLQEAIAEAGRMLAGHVGQRRVVLLSDMQRTNWSDMTLKGPAEELLPEGTVLTVIPIEGSGPENACLTLGRCQPVQPVAGQPAKLSVHVCNYAGRPRTVRVEAAVDGRAAGAKDVELQAWDAADAAFEVVLDSPGQHQVVFSSGPDALAADNVCYLVVNTVRRIPVAVVADENPNQNDLSTYYLIRALAPTGDMSDAIEVRHLTSGDLTFARIADAEAVLVGSAGKLSADALAALHMYANQGGAVILFCGEGPVAENLLALNSLTRHGDLLPWTPGPPRDLAKDGGFLTITGGVWDSPLLKEFDEASQLALKQVRFGRVWSTGPLRQGATALLTYSDGTPALASQNVGAGKIVVANFSAAMGASNLGKYGTIVALIQGLVEGLRPTQDWRAQATVGQSFSFPVQSPAAVTPAQIKVVGPDEQSFVPELVGDHQRFLVHFPAVPLPGFYLIKHGTEVLSVAAVNLDGREGDLRRMDEQTLRDRLENDRSTVQVKSSQSEGPILNVRGRPLWPWCVLAAMILVGLELALLGVWKR